MLNANNINQEITKALFENSDKFIVLIDKDTKILDYSEAFKPYADKFNFFKDLLTYTHITEFLENIKKVSNDNATIKFISNLSFNKADVEDIPATYEIVISQQNEYFLIVADPKPSLSHADTKLYLALINEYTQSSRELTKTKHSLKKLNNQLEKKVQNTVNELRKKDEILFKQSKDAAMGEMIDAIAHQWKNPLGVIKMLGDSILFEYELYGIDALDAMIKDASKIGGQVDHLVETLEEFRSFFRPKSDPEEINVQNILDSISILLKDDLIKHKISIETSGDLEKKIKVIPNEFKHVLINLISNSRDAFIEKNINPRIIKFNVNQNETHTNLTICDNAGGIPEEIINNIFDANFTTKEKGKGTGIGLYMTKQIIDKLEADIKVENIDKGTCFSIIFNLNR